MSPKNLLSAGFAFASLNVAAIAQNPAQLLSRHSEQLRGEYDASRNAWISYDRKPGFIYTLQRSFDLTSWQTVPEGSGWALTAGTTSLKVKNAPVPGAPPPAISEPGYSCIINLFGDPASQTRAAHITTFGPDSMGNYQGFRFRITSFPIPANLITGLSLDRRIENRQA